MLKVSEAFNMIVPFWRFNLIMSKIIDLMKHLGYRERELLNWVERFKPLVPKLQKEYPLLYAILATPRWGCARETRSSRALRLLNDNLKPK